MPIMDFPKSWLLNLKDCDALAKRLDFSVDYLQKLERKIINCYIDTEIKTKNKVRPIAIPSHELKMVQRKILSNVLNFQFPNYIHGGVPGRSIITNAKTHLSSNWVMCVDIKNFFPSVHFRRICDAFVHLKCSDQVATMLTHFTTHKYQLPQGTPTSPMIANIILYNLDHRFFSLCKQYGFKYSRYFDDITISGSNNPKEILPKCELIVKQEGFKVSKKPGKLRIIPSNENQIVTGLLVNGAKLQIIPGKINEIKDMMEKVNFGDLTLFEETDPVKVKSTIQGYIAFLESIDSVTAKNLKSQFIEINWGCLCS